MQEFCCFIVFLCQCIHYFVFPEIAGRGGYSPPSHPPRSATALTPAHLLHGHRIISLPHERIEEQDLEDPTFGSLTDINRRAQLQSFLLNQFRSRWRHEYLTSLREYHRTSGTNNGQHIKIGDVVLIHDDAPRITWRLAVIEELIRGKDGLVRAASIRTAQGRTNRPITKLIPLEVSQPSDVTKSTAENCISGHAQTTNSDSISATLSSNNDCKMNTSDINDRPQRLAGRENVKNWVQALGGPRKMSRTQTINRLVV